MTEPGAILETGRRRQADAVASKERASAPSSCHSGMTGVGRGPSADGGLGVLWALGYEGGVGGCGVGVRRGVHY